MNDIKERLINGLIKENPTFVLMLGMCPTLAVTTSAMNGLGMGLTTMVVLAQQCLYFIASEYYSRQGQNTGIYRNYCFFCNDGGVAAGGFYPGLV